MAAKRQIVAVAGPAFLNLLGIVVTVCLNISSTPHFITLLQLTSFLLIANKS
jgi:hypothetical protein